MKSYYFATQRRKDLVDVSVTALNPATADVKSYSLVDSAHFKWIYTSNQPPIRYMFYNLPFAFIIEFPPVLLFADDGVSGSDSIIEFDALNSDAFNSAALFQF